MTSVSRTYREYRPVPALRPYVACYWTSTAPADPSRNRVLPDGCIDILFDVSEGTFSEGTVIGTMTRPLLFVMTRFIGFLALQTA